MRFDFIYLDSEKKKNYFDKMNSQKEKNKRNINKYIYIYIYIKLEILQKKKKNDFITIFQGLRHAKQEDLDNKSDIFRKYTSQPFQCNLYVLDDMIISHHNQ